MFGRRTTRGGGDVNPPPSPIRQGATAFASISITMEGTVPELEQAAGDLARAARDFVSRARTTRGVKLVTGRLTTPRTTTDL